MSEPSTPIPDTEDVRRAQRILERTIAAAKRRQTGEIAGQPAPVPPQPAGKTAEELQAQAQAQAAAQAETQRKFLAAVSAKVEAHAATVAKAKTITRLNVAGIQTVLGQLDAGIVQTQKLAAAGAALVKALRSSLKAGGISQRDWEMLQGQSRDLEGQIAQVEFEEVELRELLEQRVFPQPPAAAVTPEPAIEPEPEPLPHAP